MKKQVEMLGNLVNLKMLESILDGGIIDADSEILQAVENNRNTKEMLAAYKEAFAILRDTCIEANNHINKLIGATMQQQSAEVECHELEFEEEVEEDPVAYTNCKHSSSVKMKEPKVDREELKNVISEFFEKRKNGKEEKQCDGNCDCDGNCGDNCKCKKESEEMDETLEEYYKDTQLANDENYDPDYDDDEISVEDMYDDIPPVSDEDYYDPTVEEDSEELKNELKQWEYLQLLYCPIEELTKEQLEKLTKQYNQALLFTAENYKYQTVEEFIRAKHLRLKLNMDMTLKDLGTHVRNEEDENQNK